MKYVTFTGEETQKEFLEKCLEQWDMSSQESPLQAIMQLGAMFSEMRHRVSELEDIEEQMNTYKDMEG